MSYASTKREQAHNGQQVSECNDEEGEQRVEQEWGVGGGEWGRGVLHPNLRQMSTQSPVRADRNAVRCPRVEFGPAGKISGSTSRLHLDI